MGESGGTLRLVVLLLLSLTTLISKSSVSGEQSIEQFYELAEAKCPKVRRTLNEEAFRKMGSCVSSKLDTAALKRQMEEADDNKAGLNAVFRQTCGKWPAVQVCTKPLIQTVKQCVPDGDQFFTAVDSLVRGICKNPARIINFFSEDGSQLCYSSGMTKFQRCGSKALPTHAKTTKEACKFFADVQGCADTAFSKCKDPDLVQSLVGDVARSLGCTGVSGLTYSVGAADHLFSHGWFLILSILIFANSYFE